MGDDNFFPLIKDATLDLTRLFGAPPKMSNFFSIWNRLSAKLLYKTWNWLISEMKLFGDYKGTITFFLFWFHWKHKKYAHFQKQEASVKKEILLLSATKHFPLGFLFLRLFYQSPKKGNSMPFDPRRPCHGPSSHKFRNTRKFKVANLKNERDATRT